MVAVDLPSGWDADSMEEKAEGAFRADAVVTFTAPKLAHVFGHLTEATFGPVVVAEIGTPEGAIVSATGLTWGGSSKAIAEATAGDQWKQGAAGACAAGGGSVWEGGRAVDGERGGAADGGAGLVTAAVPREILPIVAAVAPELMLTPLEEQSGVEVQGLGSRWGMALEQLEMSR